MARAFGIRNLNVDLMSGLPGQTLRDWRESIDAAVALDVEHVSAYSLILEEGTRYGAWWRQGACACRMTS